MLKILVQIVLISTLMFAKEMPLQQKLEIKIPVGQWAVLEFPFKIEDTTFTPFVGKVMKEDDDESTAYGNVARENTIQQPVSIPSMNGAGQQIPATTSNTVNVNGTNLKVKKNQVSKNSGKSIEVAKSENIIKILPKREGSFEAIIWGYKTPVFIKITVLKEDKEGVSLQYVKFMDYEIDSKKALNFETDVHYKVLEKLLTSMYLGNPPKGYTVDLTTKKYENKFMSAQLKSTYIGYNYKGEEWHITNLDKTRINLYEEMFVQPKVFLISIEADTLKPEETTRVWIISARDEAKDENY
ncbi:MAG: type-F conjugative transfer system secretin TraK [Arcobacteraceae bacterium]